MSLDVYLTRLEPVDVYSANITHNLARMAGEAGVYEYLWRPENVGIVKAVTLIEPLSKGLSQLLGDPDKYKALNAENGWGTYDSLVEFVKEYLNACIEYPDADVRVSR